MNKDMTRLGLFVFFDPQGVVDDYVLYLLKHLRPNFTKLVVISNGQLEEAAQKKLTAYADSLFIRDNQGLDAAAYKAGLISFCGWEEAEKYDEVVLMNDTFFGPIHSFDDMFDEMAGRDLDFWGISAGYRTLDDWKRVKYGYIPDHIQTFFIAFRKNMVCTDAFHDYWNHYDDTLKDFISVVTQNEVILTRHFQDLGFRWEIYANTQQYRARYHSENFNLYHYMPRAMMRDMHFPILKRKVLNVDLPIHLCLQDLESAFDALSYLQNETNYNTDLIWDNVLRIYNISDLYHTLHLNYVLPSVQVSMPEGKRIALVYHVANPFFAERICRHAAQLQGTVDVYILPGDKKAEAALREILTEENGIRILAPTHQKTEMGNFVLRCRELAEQYDYLGFVHDVDNPDHSPTTVPESTVYGYLQNIANDPAYLSQVINCFEQNPKLGVLGIPFPVHDYGFSNYGNMWGDCFDTVTTLSRHLHLNCNIVREKPPFMIVGAFWCRTAAIRSIWNRNWMPKDFTLNPVTCSCKNNDALIRLLPYAAQSALYYSGIVMHTNYASMRLTGQQHMLSRLTETLHSQLGIVPGRYMDYADRLSRIHYKDKDRPLTIDLSELGIASIVRIYLEQKAPQWVSKRMLRVFRFLKNRKFSK